MRIQLKKAVSVVMALFLLPFSAAPSFADNSNATVVTLDPSNALTFNNGKFEGWGTSLCWWANRIGYDEALTNKAAELFYGDSGLSLDIARYNIGGGDDPSHDHITRSDSKIPGYATGYDENSNLIYDWTAD
ncbi:MAG: alpha-L-arabinofuranosidase, partial [Hominilimicola sp.]